MALDQPGSHGQGVAPAHGHAPARRRDRALGRLQRPGVRPFDAPLVDRRVAGLGLEVVAPLEIGERVEEHAPVPCDGLAAGELSGGLAEGRALLVERGDRLDVVRVDRLGVAVGTSRAVGMSLTSSARRYVNADDGP